MSNEKQIDGANLAVLSCYRNKYYADGLATEQGIIANAINDVLPILISVKNGDYHKQIEGEWHYNPDGMDWGLGAWQCSLCGCRNDNLPMDESIKPLRWAGSKYCPNCGAKMKGGAE
jgi:hypothetical protein